jgi:hypothetical protein
MSTVAGILKIKKIPLILINLCNGQIECYKEGVHTDQLGWGVQPTNTRAHQDMMAEMG